MATFNLLRYRELLTKVDSSTKTGKEFFLDPIFIELLSLESKIETQVFYDHRNTYFTLIQKYLDKTINPYVFRGQLIHMADKNLEKTREIFKNFEELSTFWIDLELDDFCSLFEKIHETCLYAFEFDDEEAAMPENMFRDSIQKFFFKIQKYSNE